MPSPTWINLALFALASRVVTLAVGWGLCNFAPPLPWIDYGSPPRQIPLLEAFTCWDAIWYHNIARDGYRYQPDQPSNTAFLPALPILIHFSTRLGIDALFAGVFIPNLAFVVGLMFFARSLMPLGSTIVWRSSILLCAYPTAFFFSCPYQESLGFAAVAVALWSWPRFHTSLTALTIFLGSFARLTLLAFPLALLVEWFTQVLSARPRRSLPSIIFILLAWLAAMLLFALYCQLHCGDPLVHLHSHAAWDRLPPAPENVFRTLRCILFDWPSTGQIHSSIITGLSLWLFVILGLRAWLRRGVFYGVLILMPLAQAVSTGTPMSLERVVLASFPAFVDLAEILHTHRRFLFGLVVLLMLQLLLLNGYVHWQFMG